MREALTNLLSNAVKYAPQGSQIAFHLVCAGETVTIVVQDRGIGISGDDLSHLFTAFHRTRNVGSRQGTGLGLAIVKRSVDAHGGTIDVVSEEGAGTRFTLTLPGNALEARVGDDDRT